MKPWWEQTWVSYDTETTSKDPEIARVCQVAAAVFQSGVCSNVYSAEINPEAEIEEEASEVHGLTAEKLQDAPVLSEFFPRLEKVIRMGEILVGYNVYHYDNTVLGHHAGEPWKELEKDLPVIDVFPMIKMDKVGRFWKGKGRHKLGNVAKRFGLELPEGRDLHEAGSDSLLCGMILWYLMTDSPYASLLKMTLTSDPRTAEERLRVLKKKQDENFQAYLRSQGK